MALILVRRINGEGDAVESMGLRHFRVEPCHLVDPMCAGTEIGTIRLDGLSRQPRPALFRASLNLTVFNNWRPHREVGECSGGDLGVKPDHDGNCGKR
jgi:hypothetical protein